MAIHLRPNATPLAGRLVGRAPIERHLWRMCLGLTFAAGSAFTNGLPRVLPQSVHIPLPLLFVPQLDALLVLLFWLARVRLTSWYPRHMAGATGGSGASALPSVGQVG